jgi:purine-binding chemotaxis protein CheW
MKAQNNWIDTADFTHHIETLLDKVRSGVIAATPKLADIMLAGRDQVRAMINVEQGGESVPVESSEKPIAMFKSITGEEVATDVPKAIRSASKAPAHAQSNAEKLWEIRFRPDTGLFNSGGNPILLMRDLSAMGTCEVMTHIDAVPPPEEIDTDLCYLWWSATLHTSADQDAIRDVFMFVEDGSELEIKPGVVVEAPAAIESIENLRHRNIMANETFQYMTFKLGDELFAINVSQVREVLEVLQITKVPTAPAYMRGVVNVRGQAIPVVDLRLRFGLPSIADTVNTRVIVMELNIDGETAVIGGLADSVHEVIELEEGNINPPPRIAMRWRTDFILGMGKRGEEFIIILNVNAVFSSEESVAVSESSGPVKVSPEMVAVQGRQTSVSLPFVRE